MSTKALFVNCFTTIWGMAMTPLHANDELTNESSSWNIVNDDVMDGRSESRVFLLKKQNTIRFEGVISLKNNGGFASIRSTVQTGYFSDANSICMKVKGDGLQYQFRLRNNRPFDDYTYVAKFQTQLNAWQNICFYPEKFSAQFRGRLMPNIPPPTFADIKQIGFLIANKKEEAFRLDICNVMRES